VEEQIPNSVQPGQGAFRESDDSMTSNGSLITSWENTRQAGKKNMKAQQKTNFFRNMVQLLSYYPKQLRAKPGSG
jgi:hypothetical protein